MTLKVFKDILDTNLRKQTESDKGKHNLQLGTVTVIVN